MEKALQLTEALMANVKDYFLRDVTYGDRFNCTIGQRGGFSNVVICILDLDDVNAPLIRIDCDSRIESDVNAPAHSHMDSIAQRQR